MLEQNTRLVKIRSTATGTFSINEPAFGVRRIFPKKGAI
jgi:hypothetical protein|nr:MAG TPA: hypothetical protein [Caudoviricetes sp.]